MRTKEERRAYQLEWQRRPDVRARRSAKSKMPEARAKHRAYCSTHEQKAKAAARRKTPEYRERMASWRREYYSAHPDKLAALIQKTRAHNRKDSTKARLRAWRSRLPEHKKKQYRAYSLRNNFKYSAHGVTRDQADTYALSQGGLCAICMEPPGGRGPHARLHVDHDHDTGAYRAMLCSGCNSALGLLKEDIVRASALIDYIRKHKVAE